MGIRSKWRDEAFDVVVVGGGMTGLCAALASAREGARTALVQDRSVLGGNASSEIRMHICGADANQFKRNAAETGIIHEIMLENKARNDYYNYSIWDSTLLQTVYRQEGLTLFLNTSMHDAELEGDAIKRIVCYQGTTETNLRIAGKVFIDCTGNGTLSYFAGADYRTGSEGKAEFQEPDAPDQPNNNRMGNTLLFKAVNRGHPVPFRTPEWVRHFTEDDLKLRGHGNHQPMLLFATDAACPAPGKEEEGEGKRAFDCYGLDYGYWWIELPGKGPDIIDEYEAIRDELVRCVYGVWDHLKNSGDHGAENYDLEWVGMLPGIRESRRFMGDYILTENDILSNRIFPDAVAYGGWPVDNHTAGGLDDKDVMPSTVRHFPGLYTIPYRCYCSGKVANLMQAGRILSASKLAMASSRVMGTCSVGGQAAGTAAAMCVRYGCLPREIGGRMGELQQRLLRNDCYLPGFTNQDAADLARRARAEASSQKHSAANVLNGVSRDTEDAVNCWESEGLSPEGEVLTLHLEQPAKLSQVRVTFDSNLNRSIKITLSAKRIAQQQVGPPAELVRDYELRLLRGGETAAARRVEGNYQRLNVLDFPDAPLCDAIELRVTATNGYPNARVFEVRAYG